MVLQIYGGYVGQKDFIISIQGACATEIGGDSRVQGVVGTHLSGSSDATCFAATKGQHCGPVVSEGSLALLYAQTQK